MKTCKLLSLMFLTLLLVGCPVTINLAITNTTSEDIEVIYSTGFVSMIAPGETKDELFKSDCIRVRSKSKTYQFKSVMPPEGYIQTGSLSSMLYAEFTEENEFKIYKKDSKKTDFIYLKQGC